MFKLPRSRPRFWGIWLAGTIVPTLALPVAAGEPRAKIAIATTLATQGDHLRQHAFDGKADTYFESIGPIQANDHFTLRLDAPATVKAVTLTMGRPDGTDKLAGAVVEVAEDGTTFEQVATVDADGIAHAEFPARSVRSIRVQALEKREQTLVIREFTIDSDQVRPFEHPVEFTVDTSDAPDLQAWNEETARLCEQWYDALTDELATENYEPRNRVTLTMSKDYRGVAAAGGGRITGSVRYFQGHQNDQGAMIHETIHIIQNYRGRRNPGWLVEGVADYLRFFFYEPGKAGPVNPETARFDKSYRTTATFLDYVARTHDAELVKKLNKAMRQGTYDKAIFEQLTGKTVEVLNDDWIKALRDKKD